MAKSSSLERIKLKYEQVKSKQKHGLSQAYFKKVILDKRHAVKRRDIARRYAKFRKNITKYITSLRNFLRG